MNRTLICLSALINTNYRFYFYCIAKCWFQSLVDKKLRKQQDVNYKQLFCIDYVSQILYFFGEHCFQLLWGTKGTKSTRLKYFICIFHILITYSRLNIRRLVVVSCCFFWWYHWYFVPFLNISTATNYEEYGWKNVRNRSDQKNTIPFFDRVLWNIFSLICLYHDKYVRHE